jgi:dolichol-phosphate mannosyltransferase
MSSRPVACIVMPTFNESRNIKPLLSSILAEAEGVPSHEVHVLVVDDNSPDGTALVVKELMNDSPRIHLLTGTKKGLGDAYQRGMMGALKELEPDIIIQMDADFQHDPALLPLFVALSNYGFGVVIGSRFVPGGKIPNFGWYRRLISLAGTALVRAFGGLPAFTDCTSGYRCIRTEFLRKCDVRGLATRGYSFQSSLLCELVWNGAPVIEIPITFNERREGTSKLAFRDQVEFLTNLFRLLYRRLQRRWIRPHAAEQSQQSPRF